MPSPNFSGNRPGNKNTAAPVPIQNADQPQYCGQVGAFLIHMISSHTHNL